jgi:chromosome segregation ATPase
MNQRRRAAARTKEIDMGALKLVETEDAETVLRGELRKLIEERNLLKSRRDATADAVERAQAFVGRLRENLAKYDDVSSRIAKARGESFRRSLETGEALPMAPLSKELTAASMERLDAMNQLEGGEQALEALSGELSVEECELGVLERNVVGAAKRIVAHHGDMMAEELRRVENEAGGLRRRLLGLTQLRTPSIGSYPISAPTVALLRDIGANAMATGCAGADVTFWDEWLHRLTTDADARPDG